MEENCCCMTENGLHKSKERSPEEYKKLTTP